MSPEAAAVATTLTLVSCSGIKQIYHGNRETEQENTMRRDGWMGMMKSCLWAETLRDF